MTTATTPNAVAVLEIVLCIAFELGASKWKMAFSTGLGQQSRHREVAARDLEAVQREIDRARARFGLPDDARVASCYEAGRDGFWIHRALVAMGIENIIVDSASIEVSRSGRRAKTDRLDAGKLVGMLLRYHAGDRKVWSVVRVPTPALHGDHGEERGVAHPRRQASARGRISGSAVRLSGVPASRSAGRR